MKCDSDDQCIKPLELDEDFFEFIKRRVMAKLEIESKKMERLLYRGKTKI